MAAPQFHNFAEACYRFHYGLGIHTMRVCRRFGRWMGRVTAPLRHVCYYVWKRRVVWPAHRLRRRARSVWGQMRPAGKLLAENFKKNPLLVFPCFFRLCHSAIKHYWDELTAIGRLMGPIAAGAALVITILAWTNTTFCLGLTYQGQELGVVDNAAVYDQGAKLARERVNNVDDSFTVDIVPTFTLQIQDRKAPLTGYQVCDGILQVSSDSIGQATGLYVDGSFVGAMESREELEGLLQSLKDAHYDKNDPDQRADFLQKVEMEDGLYPIATVRTVDSMRGRLTYEATLLRTYMVQAGDTFGAIARKHDLTLEELRDMNPAFADGKLQVGDRVVIERARPFLQVVKIQTIRYTETIDYNTQTVYRDDKPVTYSKVTTKGQEGSQDVVAEVTYQNGEETGRKVVSKTVTKQPVTKIVERGTKKVVSSTGTTVQQGDGIATGNMVWPVPVCRNVYQGYHRGHLAIDISSGPIPVFNKPCLAVDGGTVIYAGWYYGYGYYVKIDHGNGLVSTYAHLHSMAVVKGQQVSRGQEIGRVGNTGYSTGPHLHFEIIKNGVKVNPLNYVKP